MNQAPDIFWSHMYIFSSLLISKMKTSTMIIIKIYPPPLFVMTESQTGVATGQPHQPGLAL